MFSWIINHQWKEKIRSVLWKRTLVTNIIFTVLFVIFAINLLSFGLSVGHLFEQFYPDLDPLVLINGVIFYYLLFDLLLRYFLQKTAGVNVRPYLLLPVKRKNIVRFIFIRSVGSLFNILPLFLLIPLLLTVVVPAHGLINSIIWFVTIYCLILINSFLILFLKKQSLVTVKQNLLFLILLLIITFLDFADLIHFHSVSQTFFNLVLEFPLLIAIPLGLLLVIYYLNKRLFCEHLYTDHARLFARTDHGLTGRLDQLNRLGTIGTYLALELKLLFRNRRARATIIMAFSVLIITPYVYYALGKVTNYYPIPTEEEIGAIHNLKTEEWQSQVTFIVITDSLADDHHVYITGDHSQFGPWKPATYPLIRKSPDKWKRTFIFDKGTELRYIFTLGSWATEMRKAEVYEPDVKRLTVKNDTTVVLAGPLWKLPQRPVFIDAMMLYMGLLFTGMLMIGYGSFMFSWESKYFDLILANRIDLKTYFRAKYHLLVVFGIILFLLTIPLIYFSPFVLYVNLVSLIYNIGVNTLVLFYLVTYSRKRFDLNASIISTQGKGSNQFLAILPTVIFPVFIFLPFAILGDALDGFLFLTLLGVIGILFKSHFLNMIQKSYQKRRYLMAAGFRQP